jgi:hypothetical protein
LDGLTYLEIKNQLLKYSIYYGLLLGTPLTLIWNFLVIKSKTKRIIWTIVPSIILILILVINPVKIFFSSGIWMTQTIIYKHGHLSFRTIEFQIQDKGALGFNKRTVEVLYLTDLFMITSEVPNNIEKKLEWFRVDMNVNENGFK